ncbi:MAG TPA: type II toxin-antitoxin system RelE/ParE family toxin [Blastocatellia bacterium]|nr:type II toxin-antitoxin system RelE/ParE family toxin [Blastocatellia bacterium]
MNVQFRASFAKDLKKISNKDILNNVRETIDQIGRAPGPQDISGLTKLKGARNYYRVRVGEYRIGLILEGDTVVFVRCLDRKEIYRYFP